MDYYKPIYFKPEEFVDRATYNKFGDNCLLVMDIRTLITMDRIRAYLNKPITINNWKTGGNREWSGIRTCGSPFYNQYSQHSMGRACDFIVSGMDSQSVRNLIKAAPSTVTAFEFITAIEEFSGMSWVHVDCRLWDKTNKGIFVFSNQE